MHAWKHVHQAYFALKEFGIFFFRVPVEMLITSNLFCCLCLFFDCFFFQLAIRWPKEREYFLKTSNVLCPVIHEKKCVTVVGAGVLVVLNKIPCLLFLINFSALTVVHFHAPWALQCKQMSEVMTELAKENSHVKFVKVSPIVGKS